MSIGQNLTIQTPSHVKHGFRSALMTNLRIVGALMMREGMLRYGHESLGFFWVMGEPLFLTVGVMGMWTITGATHGHGVGVVPFALSGYMMITLWRHLTGKAVHSIRNNAGLLFHRNIRLLDILIARGMLEVLGIFTAFFIAWVPLTLLGVIEPMSDPLAVRNGLSPARVVFLCGGNNHRRAQRDVGAGGAVCSAHPLYNPALHRHFYDGVLDPAGMAGGVALVAARQQHRDGARRHVLCGHHYLFLSVVCGALVRCAHDDRVAPGA